MGALEGIRVLDLTRVLAGPTATQTLADLGAEVVKVERPGSGDDTRGWGPPYVKDAQGRDTSESTYFASANRGKKSVTIDLGKPEGAQLVRQLAEHCDILIENYKVGDLARRGLDYASLSAGHPALIYCSITGFGQTGPYSERAGYDPIAQAMSGMMSVTGEPEGAEGTAPQRVGVAVIDLITAHYAVIGILAALRYRDRCGRGQHLDLGLLDVGVASMANIASAFLGAGEVSRRNGGVHPSVLPSQVFRCADGHVIVAAANDGQFARLCAAGGRVELAKDPRFATNTERVRNRALITPMLEAMFLEHPIETWTTRLAECGVPCGPILGIEQVFDDPQVRARNLVISMPYAPAGEFKAVANPMKMSETPPVYRLPPPQLGEHTHVVLSEWLGLGAEDVRALRAKGVL
ncbi:MAG: CaiB/BaiF CoA transferase family protein [Burkholderiales bacterium]